MAELWSAGAAVCLWLLEGRAAAPHQNMLDVPKAYTLFVSCCVHLLVKKSDGKDNAQNV